MRYHCFNKDLGLTIARQLLEIKAIKLQPHVPFTWASGWKSPIYCDNRLSLSFPEVRNNIKLAFFNLVKDGMVSRNEVHVTAVTDDLLFSKGRRKLIFIII